MRSSGFGLFESDILPVDNQVTFSSTSAHDLNQLLKECEENVVYVFWYIGPYGLKQGAVDFYKPILTSNMIQGAISFIVDLTAWGAFQKKCKLSDYHECAVSLDGDSIKTLRSSHFFEALQALSENNNSFFLINDIAGREELTEPSKSYQDSGMTVKELFNGNCPALAALYELDCAKTYCVMQYIEFLFYVEMIVQKNPATNKIRFLLPNDEAKYYFSTMQDDLIRFLKTRGHKGINLDIQVKCFNYGEQLSHRPYNLPSQTIARKKKLAFNQVVESDVQTRLQSRSSCGQ